MAPTKPPVKPTGKAASAAKPASTAVARATKGAAALTTLGDATMARMIADAKQGNNFSKDDLAIPFLRVLQKLSPQLDRKHDLYLEEARESNFFDTASKTCYPAEKAEGEPGILFVPAWYTPSYTQFKIREKGGGFVRDFGADSSILLKTTRDEKNRNILHSDPTQQIVYSMMYYGFIIREEDGQVTGDTDAVVLPLAGSQLKKARDWNTYMDKFRTEYQGVEFNPPHYFNAFRLTTVYESNDQGNWYGVTIERECATHELPNGERVLNLASQFREALAKGTARAKMDEIVDAEVTDDVPAGRADGGKAF